MNQRNRPEPDWPSHYIDWYEQSKPSAYFAAFRKTSCRELAEDAVQEAVLAMWQHRYTFECKAAFQGMLLKITKQRAIAFSKKRQQFTDKSTMADVAAFVHEDLSDEAVTEHLSRCLEQMGEADQALIRMSCVEQLPQEVIGEKIGRHRNTIRRNLKSVFERFRQLYWADNASESQIGDPRRGECND